ncbi:MAG TPA: hypothetical protein DCX03_00990 [Bacteroidales bacterium]|nr:hypothetical protein [Bacteroidales bacterium]
MTEKGISTTKAEGTENYEDFILRSGRNSFKRVQYDYRHTDGRLFSVVCPSLVECREKRDKWLVLSED